MNTLKPRGFAAMPHARVMQICKMGGKMTSKKYGPKHFAKIGKKGGKKTGALYRAFKESQP